MIWPSYSQSKRSWIVFLPMGWGMKLFSSVNRWVYYFSIFAHLHEWKFAERHTKFVKLCEILNELLKNCRKLFRFCQSGEISPNLVTLLFSWKSRNVPKAQIISCCKPTNQNLSILVDYKHGDITNLVRLVGWQ